MKPEDPLEWMRASIYHHVQSLIGSTEPVIGVELAALIRRIALLYELTASTPADTEDLSHARWGVLFRLLAETQHGNTEGLTPTYLSRCLHVSKNTVSALLRGLEAQGLIQRVLDPQDRRRFRIRLTEAGHTLVAASAPQRIAYLNQVIADLTPAEQEQLVALLTKLYRSLAAHHSQTAGAASPRLPSEQRIS